MRLDLLLVEDRVVLSQDNLEVTAGQLRDQASGIAGSLLASKQRRVALVTSRVDLVVSAMLACQEAGCELLLLREDYPDDADVWSSWGVSGRIRDDLSVRELGAGWAKGSGFALLLATSGTTGAPKVARHLLPGLVGRIRSSSHLHEPARWLLTYHVTSFAGLQVLLTGLMTGGQVVSLSRPTLAALVRAALDHQASHISGTPTFWKAFLMALGDDSRKLEVRQITLGGEPADQTTLDRLRGKFPDAVIVHIYASTEAGSLFSVRDGRPGFPARWLEDGVDGVRLRIREGVLQVLSPRAMQGYVSATGRNPVLNDGWIHTGDLVAVEGDRVFFLGRDDSVINVGGIKVLPEEVENVLIGIPGIADVRVFGIPNAITGFIVAAEIVAEADADCKTIRRMILEHTSAVLGPPKVPRIIRFVDHIESSPSGKKDRVKWISAKRL